MQFLGRSAALAGILAVVMLALSSEAEETPSLHKPAVNLSEVDNAESTLTTARVKDRDGVQLGQVHGITRGVDGEIKTVQVALDPKPAASPKPAPKGSEDVVALSAHDMVYLREPNVILASVTREEAEALPRLAQ
jgi:hypothetical protein